ncbi:MAG: hypothetical protein Fur005_25220 [Roseiflexaceae bacterium]
MAPQQTVLSPRQLEELRHSLAQVAQQATIRCALLADLSGQELVAWSPRGGIDLPTVAALAASDVMATIEISRMLGGQRSCNLIIQEHEEQTILIGRVGEGFLLLLATGRDVPLGWARLALKSVTNRILAIAGTAAMTPPPVAVTDEFATQFSAQLDTIW